MKLLIFNNLNLDILHALAYMHLSFATQNIKSLFEAYLA